jgi:hypothetical protein
VTVPGPLPSEESWPARPLRLCRIDAYRHDGAVEFEIAFQDGIGRADIEIALSGVATHEGFFRFTETLQSDPRFRAGLRLLVDLTGFDASALPDAAVNELSEHVVERDWAHPPAGVAIIAPDERTFEAARLYRANLGGSRSNRHVFRSRAEAVAWLEERG